MKYKKIIYIGCLAAMVLWTGYRIYAINSESRRVVFNAEREARKNGELVNTVVINKKTDFLYEPLVIKNNIAYVSSDRIYKFAQGQIIDSGKIIFVSKNIDLDSGMFRIKTSGVSDGMHFVKIQKTGLFIPIQAVSNGFVMMSKNGIATKQKIVISDQDSKQVLVSSGLDNGDIIILSPVEEVRKIK